MTFQIIWERNVRYKIGRKGVTRKKGPKGYEHLKQEDIKMKGDFFSQKKVKEITGKKRNMQNSQGRYRKVKRDTIK